jgi:hypothetical protein
MADFKSVLKPENSIIMGAATVGIVAGIYQLDVGPVSQVQASDAYHPANSSTIKKAGYTALVAVAGLALLARDPNIVILGGAAIIAFHAHYRHANMVNPGTGLMESPGATAYQPAQNTVPASLQAAA